MQGRNILPLGLLPLGHFPHSVAQKSSGKDFMDIVTETAIVSFKHCSVGFPLPTISNSPLFTLFVPGALKKAVDVVVGTSSA